METLTNYAINLVIGLSALANMGAAYMWWDQRKTDRANFKHGRDVANALMRNHNMKAHEVRQHINHLNMGPYEKGMLSALEGK